MSLGPQREGIFDCTPILYANSVGFALVVRDAARLMLSQRSQGHPGMWLQLVLATPDEIDEIYREWEGKGARIIERPANRPWGNYEMRVADLDGHVLRLASPAKPTT